MGYIQHHAIVVTTYDEVRADQARAAAAANRCPVTAAHKSGVNSYYTFLVLPDGSKEGWFESDFDDRNRGAFVSWLRSQAFDDGSNPYAWVEVQYGDDDGVTMVVGSSDDDYKARVEGETV